MKSFLTSWIEESSQVLSRELGIDLRIETGGRLPAAEACITLATNSAQGAFTVSVDAGALASLLVEARVIDEQPDRERDLQLWQGLLQQTLTAIGKSLRGQAGSYVFSPLVESRETGSQGVPCQLIYGERSVPMAVVDRVTQAAPAPDRKAAERPHAPAAPAPGPGSMDLLLDIELEASLRFGSCEMPLKEVLELGPGDVVQLDRHVADPVDLIVGDKIVARGEVVLVNGNFGLRISEVAEPRKSLESIRCLF